MRQTHPQIRAQFIFVCNKYDVRIGKGSELKAWKIVDEYFQKDVYKRQIVNSVWSTLSLLFTPAVDKQRERATANISLVINLDITVIQILQKQFHLLFKLFLYYSACVSKFYINFFHNFYCFTIIMWQRHLYSMFNLFSLSYSVS